MKNWRVLGVCGAAMVLSVAVSCSTERDYGGGANEAAGSAGDSGDGSTAGGGSNGEAGSVSRSGGNGGAAAGANGGSAGSAPGAGGGAGGAEEGIAGSTGLETCPKNSCCLASGTVERDTVSPENACLGCQPFRSTTEWSDLNGELCHSGNAEVFWPAKVSHQTQSCGEGGQCGAVTSSDPVAEQMLVKTPTGPVDNLFLELTNLRASDSLGVTKAVFRFTLKAEAALQVVRLSVSGVAQPVCTYNFSNKTYTELTCDVTAAVKTWMTLPAAAERTITISTQNMGNPVTVYSQKAATEGLRPALLLDYSASCEGDQCVTIAK